MVLYTHFYFSLKSRPRGVFTTNKIKWVRIVQIYVQCCHACPINAITTVAKRKVLLTQKYCKYKTFSDLKQLFNRSKLIFLFSLYTFVGVRGAIVNRILNAVALVRHLRCVALGRVRLRGYVLLWRDSLKKKETSKNLNK